MKPASNTAAVLIEKQPQVIIRPELNVERWPIWLPVQSRAEVKKRVFTDATRHWGNDTVISTLTIEPLASYGNLTTEDEKVWYGLIKLWEDAEKPTELVFSLRKLAEVLERKWGADTLVSLKKSLHRLRATYFVWENSYTIRNEKGQDTTLELLDTFTLLVDLKLAKLTPSNHNTKEACKIRFHEHIESNLRNNYTRPTNLSTILGFKSGITLLVYKLLEWKLYKQDSYTRSSKRLFGEDLCLFRDNPGEKEDPGNREYKKTSVRKRVLDNVVTELNNNVVICGAILKAKLERSKYDKDWLFIAEKSAQLELALDNAVSGVATTPSNISSFPREIDGNAEILVQYFLERFAAIRRTTPQKKEIEQARTLLASHQLEAAKARQFIDYAKEQANDTGFDVQNFGGILQYVEKWLAYRQQAQRVTSSIFIPKQCHRCENSNGFVYVFDTVGSRSAMRCPHDEEILAAMAQEKRVTVQTL
jgi:hypothetical protein